MKSTKLKLSDKSTWPKGWTRDQHYVQGEPDVLFWLDPYWISVSVLMSGQFWRPMPPAPPKPKRRKR